MIYLDHNATTPLHPVARQAWLDAADQFIGNPSSPHRLGRRAERALDEARASLARLLGGEAHDFVWTSGATESNNLALHHLARTLPDGAEVWVSALEHPCVLEAAAHYFPARQRLMPARPSGVIDLEWLRAELSRRRPGVDSCVGSSERDPLAIACGAKDRERDQPQQCESDSCNQRTHEPCKQAKWPTPCRSITETAYS